MNHHSILRAAFEDELSKIAGELTGHVRSGRRPIGVDRLLERESESLSTPSEAFAEKLSSAAAGAEAGRAAGHAAGKFSRYAAPMVLGAGVYHVGRRANEDRRMGRMMRLQQGQ